MFEIQKLKNRILLAYAIPLALSIIVAFVVYAQVKQVQRRTELVGGARETVQYINLATYGLSSMVESARGYLLAKESSLRKDYDVGQREYRKGLAELTKLITDKKQLDTLKRFEAIGHKVEEFTALQISLANEGKTAQAVELFRKHGIPLGSDINTVMNELTWNEQEIMQLRENEVTDAARTLVTIQVAGILLSILIAMFIGMRVAAGISATLIGAINSSSAAATEISVTVTQHERTAAMQSASLNEATTTMEELAVSSRQTTDQAQSAAELARKTNTLTEEGSEAVRHSIEAMNGLKVKMGEVAEQILSLSEKTGQIGNISDLVKDLSSQINMLALNAAVEAARAGEHGKGFAVVAAEVRKLSVESRKSAEQSKAIVAGIQKATDATIMKTEEGARSIENVTTISHKVNTLFESISETAGQVYNTAQQVVLNARQQSMAINQVVEAANSINIGVKEMAAGITQTKLGIQNFTEMSEKIRKMV